METYLDLWPEGLCFTGDRPVAPEQDWSDLSEQEQFRFTLLFLCTVFSSLSVIFLLVFTSLLMYSPIPRNRQVPYLPLDQFIRFHQV